MAKTLSKSGFFSRERFKNSEFLILRYHLCWKYRIRVNGNDIRIHAVWNLAEDLTYLDYRCPENLACVADPISGRKMCKDPCEFAFCVPGAQCKAIGHKPYCSCPPKHRGDPTDPNIGCYKVQCESDKDCSANKACHAKSFQCVGKRNYFCLKMKIRNEKWIFTIRQMS